MNKEEQDGIRTVLMGLARDIVMINLNLAGMEKIIQDALTGLHKEINKGGENDNCKSE